MTHQKNFLSNFTKAIIKLLHWKRSRKSNTPPSDLITNTTDSDFRLEDAYTSLAILQSNQDTECQVVRSQRTGCLYVAKYMVLRNPPPIQGQLTGRRKPLPQEAKILLQNLTPHPNIIRFFAVERYLGDTPRGDYQLRKGVRYRMYMEYCSGGDLLEQLNKFSRQRIRITPPVFTLHVFVSLIHALAYLHYGIRYEVETGEYTQTKVHEAIIHGDIKPENILLRWPPNVESSTTSFNSEGFLGKNALPDIVLADFDMASLDSESWGITGTPDYDSPEVKAVASLMDVDEPAYHKARNAKIMTVKSDVYQLGHIMHLMATGRRFTTGADPEEIMLGDTYRNLTGFTSALVWCLQPKIKDRAECSANQECGLLEGAVQVLMKQSDALVRKGEGFKEGMWRFVRLDEGGSSEGESSGSGSGSGSNGSSVGSYYTGESSGDDS